MGFLLRAVRRCKADVRFRYNLLFLIILRTIKLAHRFDPFLQTTIFRLLMNRRVVPDEPQQPANQHVILEVPLFHKLLVDSVDLFEVLVSLEFGKVLGAVVVLFGGVMGGGFGVGWGGGLLQAQVFGVDAEAGGGGAGGEGAGGF